MSTELDLVREFMELPEESQPILLRARSVLDDAIELEQPIGQAPTHLSEVRSARRAKRRRSRWLAMGLSLAAAVVAVAAVVVQSTKPTSHQNASAIIGRLADYVQPLPSLGSGQWYQYQLRGVLLAKVNSGTKTAPVRSTASIPVAIGEWSNATGAVCTSDDLGSATFATSADAQAWETMGLVTAPANQPATGCAAGFEASLERGGVNTPVLPTNVSAITHDPTTLATELEDGSTGISAVDHYGDASSPDALAFLRLTNLLVGPLTGQWSGFSQEMLKTMAMLPNITSLGTLTTHSGLTGLGFSLPTQVTLNSITGAVLYTFIPPTVILDAHDGHLLEVRNYDFPILQNAAQDFVASASAMVNTDRVSYGTTGQWLDPAPGLEIIDRTAIPTWISGYHVIEAVSTPTATDQQISNVINPYLGNGNSEFDNRRSTCSAPPSGENVPTCVWSPGVATYDVTIQGTSGAAQTLASALRASGLFSSVSVEL